jgi:catechol 2,3-dioxygenase-like lactoylglutathione lyase family enzyme
MIQRLSHVSVFVLDQERALAFYRDRLGFDVRRDETFGPGMRWVTVGPKSQPDLELVLLPTSPNPMMTPERSAALRALIEDGAFGIGVFETADVQATYRELLAKGVKTRGEPQERPYGTEVVVQDDSGNWFSLVQRPAKAR